MSDYICSLSGSAIEATGFDDGDQFEESEEGSIRITVERRYPNPEWEAIEDLIDVTADQLMAANIQQNPKLTEEQKAMLAPMLRLQAEATYAALQLKYPRYLYAEEVRWVADPSEFPALATEAVEFFGAIDIDLEDLGIEQESIQTDGEKVLITSEE